MRATKHLLFFLFFSICFANFTHAQKDNTEEKIKRFIQKKIEFNKQIQTGYSILLYNGNENKALDVFTKFKTEFSSIPVKISYSSPDWKVVTPNYKTKIEVERVYLRIVKSFPNAKII